MEPYLGKNFSYCGNCSIRNRDTAFDTPDLSCLGNPRRLGQSTVLSNPFSKPEESQHCETDDHQRSSDVPDTVWVLNQREVFEIHSVVSGHQSQRQHYSRQNGKPFHNVISAICHLG